MSEDAGRRVLTQDEVQRVVAAALHEALNTRAEIHASVLADRGLATGGLGNRAVVRFSVEDAAYIAALAVCHLQSSQQAAPPKE